MREVSIAANYAEALLALAQQAKAPGEWGVMFGDVAAAIEQDPRLKRFLESPRVSESRKRDIIGAAFAKRMPKTLVRFLQILVHNRRQMLIPPIASEYTRLLDDLEGRIHADVTVARPMDAAAQAALADRLTKAMGRGKRVTPVIRVFPAIMGGAIVRIGDTVVDGSVRTRLGRLRQLLAAAQ
jgi:F-type H+-transporting ATPase subunit delta